LFGPHAASGQAGTPIHSVHRPVGDIQHYPGGTLCRPYKHSQPNRLLALIADLLQELQVIDFDAACAERFGQVRGTLLQKGISVSTTDLMIASAAVVHNLTLVTHNTADYQNIPGVRLDDWLVP
jgi:tRNA(fMet)-specific endonuclease VapC